MSDLEIPEAAYEAGEHACSSLSPRKIASLRLQLDTAIEAAAPLIVAATLRQLQNNLITKENPHAIWRALGHRAQELDPKGLTK